MYRPRRDQEASDTQIVLAEARETKSMAKNKKKRASQSEPRRPAITRRTIKRNEETSQLLERGEGPTDEEQLDPGVDSPSEITTEGGPGTDASYEFGGPERGPRESPNEQIGGTGGDGGYSTLGGGVYPDEGSEDDAPSYGDWQRHSSGTTSGARGQEGLSFPGEHTWGEAQDAAEREEGQGAPQGSSAPRARRRPNDTLAREIHEILTQDPELDATEIQVEVERGAVTLTGVVASREAKLLAEELVESITGVREVHNALMVTPVR
ncbi:MAG: BON domain-containing protein [Gemmatimonadales bacterium]